MVAGGGPDPTGRAGLVRDVVKTLRELAWVWRPAWTGRWAASGGAFVRARPWRASGGRCTFPARWPTWLGSRMPSHRAVEVSGAVVY